MAAAAKFILVWVMMVMGSSPVMAQSDRAVKRSVATVLFASIGGAVLGLSTLPFYGEPQEHTQNISTGALVGFAAGLGYAIYDRTKPPETSAYEYSQWNDWDQKNKRAFVNRMTKALLFQLHFEF